MTNLDFRKEHRKDKPSNASARPTIYVVDGEHYIFCPIRKRAYKVDNKPEEIVRQWWLYRLKEVYGYSFDEMGVEVRVRVGSTEAKKAADIVVYTDAKRRGARIFIEVKKPKRKDGVDQLQVYMNATGCRLGLWSNGSPPHVYLLRIEPAAGEEEATWRELRNIPKKNEQIADVDTPITRGELVPSTDFLAVLRECEDHIKAHEGANVFDECFKLVFAKLYDERVNLRNDDSPAQFRVGVLEEPEQARTRIEKLFSAAKKKWSGVFGDEEVIQLTDQSLAFCVSAMQKIFLLKSSADVLGSAFEVMINPNMKGDKGQYFTPRHVIKMCVDIIAPKEHETVFDPACGSGGFLIGAIDFVNRLIAEGRDDPSETLENQKDYASQNVYGLDYERIVAKVAKAYMLIWGDGRSNIHVADALYEDNWPDRTLSTFTEGKGKTRRLRRFDIIMTNPPFAGDISADSTLSKYELAYKSLPNGERRRMAQAPRDTLFLERSINMLSPGGRMAIVLPRGTLKNYSDEYVRRYILTHARIVGVVSLSGDMFKPFTNTKTCVLFIQKRFQPLSNLDGVKNDKRVVFCVTERPGKDRRGNLQHDANGAVVADLDEIANYFQRHAKWEASDGT